MGLAVPHLESWRGALAIVKPETVIAWHRAGFRLVLWTWKVRRGQPGRPVISREVRGLIRKMCRENPYWGAPRIHGELLKLGIDVGESSVSKYMVHGRKPPSQTWRTFLENHAQQLVSIDFFTVPTIRFQVLYVFLVLAHDRRRILHFNVTSHASAEWTGQQLREAFPFDQLPRYLLRDRDAVFGADFRGQVRDMGIPTAGSLGSCDESSRESPQLRPVFRGGVVISWSNTRRKLCGAKRRPSRVGRSEDVFASPTRTATVEPTTVDRSA